MEKVHEGVLRHAVLKGGIAKADDFFRELRDPILPYELIERGGFGLGKTYGYTNITY